MADKENYFQTTHINVRQSIAFLVLKLILIEFIFALIIYNIAFPHSLLQNFFTMIPDGSSLKIIIFLLTILAKIYFDFMAIYQWLNEYYEITPTKVLHRKGFIFRKEQCFELAHIKLAEVKQSFLGKLLNYGTIHLYDPYSNKNIYIYLIHNPMRYHRILKDLIPKLDDERETIMVHKVFEE